MLLCILQMSFRHSSLCASQQDILESLSHSSRWQSLILLVGPAYTSPYPTNINTSFRALILTQSKTTRLSSCGWRAAAQPESTLHLSNKPQWGWLTCPTFATAYLSFSLLQLPTSGKRFDHTAGLSATSHSIEIAKRPYHTNICSSGINLVNDKTIVIMSYG